MLVYEVLRFQCIQERVTGARSRAPPSSPCARGLPESRRLHSVGTPIGPSALFQHMRADPSSNSWLAGAESPPGRGSRCRRSNVLLERSLDVAAVCLLHMTYIKREKAMMGHVPVTLVPRLPTDLQNDDTLRVPMLKALQWTFLLRRPTLAQQMQFPTISICFLY